MYHNKRKAPPLQRIKVECLFCHHQLNRDKFENHRRTKHSNDEKCHYAIVTDSKQMKLSFASATATGPGAGGLESGSDVGQQQVAVMGEAGQAGQESDIAQQGAGTELGASSSSSIYNMVSNVTWQQLLNSN